jgi:hypothetical protein
MTKEEADALARTAYTQRDSWREADLLAAISQAILDGANQEMLAERERCAVIVDGLKDPPIEEKRPQPGWNDAVTACSTQIRAPR